MPKKYHELKAVSFVQATEEEDKVMQAIWNLLDSTDIGEIERSETEGVHSNPIIFITVRIKKERQILRILSHLATLDIWKEALTQIDHRLDEEMVFHVRVDKGSAYDNEPVLWSGGESIELKLKVASYPASWERAKEIILKP